MVDGLVVEAGRGCADGWQATHAGAAQSAGPLQRRGATRAQHVRDRGRRPGGPAGGPDIVQRRGVDAAGAGAAAGGRAGGRAAGHGGRRPRQGAGGRPGQLRAAGSARGRAVDAAADRGVARLPGRAACWRRALGLPVLLDNDAAAAAIGEYWMGAVDPRSTYGCIYMATGIGGGVVVAGEVYRGSSSNSVEIGHISMDVNGDECPCGNVGCLENYAGPSAVVRQALATPGLAQRLALDPDRRTTSSPSSRGSRPRRTPAIRRTAASIEQSARYLGYAAVTMAMPVRPGHDRPGRAELRGGRLDLPDADPAGGGPSHVRAAGAPVRVVPSVNGSDAAAIGGAVLVLQSELTLRHPRPDDEARPVPAGTTEIH